MKSTRKKYQPHPMALVFDWDGVFQEEKPDEEITGLLEPKQIEQISALAQKHNIPVYIVTSRTVSKKQHVIKMLTDLKIFDPSGPFKAERIHCLGVEKKLKNGAKCNLAVRHPKVNSVIEIHKELSHLPKEKILFIDNSKEHIEPVQKAGYPIILAEEGGDYFQRVIDAIKTTLEIQWMNTTTSNKSTFFQTEEGHDTQASTSAKSVTSLGCK